MRIYAKIVGDLFHIGHVRFLKAAKELGSHLTVCAVPDERVIKYKRPPILTTQERMEVIASCRYVDEVIDTGPKITTLDFMHTHGFDLYVFGAKDEAEYQQRLRDCKELPPSMIKTVPYLAGISSTEILQRIFERFNRHALSSSISK